MVELAKIIFSTIDLFKEENNDNNTIKLYNKLLEIINQYFDTGKIKQFNDAIAKEKFRYLTFCNTLTKEETVQLNKTIEKISEPQNKKISDFDKTKNFIKDNIEYSSLIKRYIAK